jgi:energy-converting hydrogenase Eha subunit G
MKVFSRWVLALNFLHVLVALRVATSTGGDRSISIYSFTVPHLGMIVFAVCLLVWCVRGSRFTVAAFSVTGIALVASLATAAYAMFKWPGGNDGPGIAWSYIVVGFSILNVFAGLILLAAVLAELSRQEFGE